MSEPKPCPFCGGNVDPEGWLDGAGNKGPECEGCGATAESMVAWSHRAADAVAAAIHAQSSTWPIPWATPVRKTGSGYSGPGKVRGYAIAEDGSTRLLIGHRIEGGEGEFFHVYTPKQVEIAVETAKGDSDNG